MDLHNNLQIRGKPVNGRKNFFRVDYRDDIRKPTFNVPLEIIYFAYTNSLLNTMKQRSPRPVSMMMGVVLPSSRSFLQTS